MNTEEMKKKFESGDYHLCIKHKGCDWRTASFDECFKTIYKDLDSHKLIHKRHEDILNAYLKDNNTLINVWVETCAHGAYGKADWENEPSFIENYSESNGYQIAKENILMKDDKPLNNFKDYGFEADFEGEILKEVEGILLGYTKDKKENRLIPCSWDSKDGCVWDYNYDDRGYKLNPIKKPWYEDESNFPCLMKKDGWFMSVHNKQDYLYNSRDGYVLATLEEVMKLVIEE